MTLPMVDLRPMLAATEPAWRANLARLFDRMQFILGELVAAFETELAQAFGSRFAVTVGSGTAAIELSLRASGLKDGAEVLVPSLTSPFTAQAVLAADLAVLNHALHAFRLVTADPHLHTLRRDQALVARAYHARIVTLGQTFAGWAPRELGL